MLCSLISQRPRSDEITILPLCESIRSLYCTMIFGIDTYLYTHAQIQKKNINVNIYYVPLMAQSSTFLILDGFTEVLKFRYYFLTFLLCSATEIDYLRKHWHAILCAVQLLAWFLTQSDLTKQHAQKQYPGMVEDRTIPNEQFESLCLCLGVREFTSLSTVCITTAGLCGHRILTGLFYLLERLRDSGKH